jgi:hypothetical protein
MAPSLAVFLASPKCAKRNISWRKVTEFVSFGALLTKIL